MPFQQMSKDEQRRKLAWRVLGEHVPVTQAAREMGVSRPTAYLWIGRARQEGIASLSARSRRPHRSPGATDPQIEASVLATKVRYPAWGAKKIHALLWPPGAGAGPAPVCVRTVDRLLARHGLTGRSPRIGGAGREGPCRFERDACNELWQLDYKGVGTTGAPAPLSILDDHSRFCLALQPVAAKTGQAAWEVLWEVFGAFGLPQCLLSDNGDGFNCTRAAGPTWLQARLWRLGIRTTHGRPRHPQTQGKVERFHRTLALEGGDVLGEAEALCRFRHRYNWVRPHEALGMRVPGALYVPSPCPRPGRLPEHQWPEGAVVRKVDAYGKISYRGRAYHPGRGLAGEWVQVCEEETGEALVYAGVRIAALERLRAP